MASNSNLAYKLTLLFTLLHFGSSQYYAPLVPEPRFGFGIMSSLFSGFGGGSCRASNFQSGTCLDFSRCSATGGIASGSCGLGLKTCCLPASQVTMTTRRPTSMTSTTASSTTSVTSTTPTPNAIEYLIKDFPMKMRDSLIIKRISSSYCQLKIDFEAFDIDPTNKDTGICPLDGKWTVSGQRENKANVPDLCGKNSGQHMYLQFDEETPITMRLVTTLEESYWLVKTTQIRCNDQNKDTYQLANLEYVVCIGNENSPFNTITWKQARTSVLSFTISLSASLIITKDTSFIDLPGFGDNNEDVNKDKCLKDFVELSAEGKFDTNKMATKFCGLGFPTEVKFSSFLVEVAPRVHVSHPYGMAVYLNFDSDKPIIMNLNTKIMSSDWKIKTTQIGCDSEDKAPPGCLQYFTDQIEKKIKSFNYITIYAIPTKAVTYQPANLKYVACVKRPSPNYIYIKWMPSDDSDYSFTVSGDVSTIGIIGVSCMKDYVSIDEYPNGGEKQFCGTGFSTFMGKPDATKKTFKLTVNTNEGEKNDGDIGNVGFNLHYELIPN